MDIHGTSRALVPVDTEGFGFLIGRTGAGGFEFHAESSVVWGPVYDWGSCSVANHAHGLVCMFTLLLSSSFSIEGPQ